jgi:hypothetical protein
MGNDTAIVIAGGAGCKAGGQRSLGTKASGVSCHTPFTVYASLASR